MAPDVLNINESWQQYELPDHLVNITDSSLIRHDCTALNADGTIKRGGGLCTYGKQGLNFDVLNDLVISNEDIELLVIQYNVPCTRGIYVLNVYRPPTGDMENFINHLQLCIEMIRMHEGDIFIGGDFNIDIKRQNTPHYSKLSRFLNQLKQYIKYTTRPDSDTTIDLLLSNREIIQEVELLMSLSVIIYQYI